MGSSQIKLSWQEGKGWKNSIGKHRGKNGKSQYKMWYLGRDKSKAQNLVEYITLEWKQIKRSGAEVWNPEALERISDYKDTLITLPKNQDQSNAKSPDNPANCAADSDYSPFASDPQHNELRQYARTTPDLTTRLEACR